MLSRRNVRVKVMQLLYSLNRDDSLVCEEACKQYRTIVRQSYESYLYSLFLVMRVAAYADKDAGLKSAKHGPTAQDLAFRPHLATNSRIQSLLDHLKWNALIMRQSFDKRVDEETIRLLYNSFAETEAYIEYASTEHPTEVAHKEQLLALYRHLLSQELFVDLIEDFHPLWSDDKSLIVGAVKRTLKALPSEDEFYKVFEPAEETVIDFGEKLLRDSVQNDSQLLAWIEPALTNWDAERVAIVDMILLKMAVTEMMEFPTIPTKVTLNEYVDLAKSYSTDKSKDFVNGILDRLLRDLYEKGAVNKEGRGLKE